ncbi:unnamed protein product [Anisakis simplex]|uniref:Phage protein n=1 Tax=Anisakis simplex TaxID=6269 RepID=A0A0M3JLG8_ANISI|nr:unnamed protein product [Anisakis simplex]
MALQRVTPELLDWQKMCEDEFVETQKERIKVLMDYLRMEQGVIMKATNR